MRLALPLVALAVVSLAAYVPSGSLATSDAPPEGEAWENLQVLPDSISREELVDVMKGFTRSLGVRCQHCHVGEEGQDLSEFDFPSDAKPSKEATRGMMRMTWQINREILPVIAGLPRDTLSGVTCATCHRGQPRPSETRPMPHPGAGGP